MKKIIYTQRVEIVKSYGERRDCADQMIPKFLRYCGYIPIPVPNVPELIEDILSEIKPQGIFFSGGNSLVKYGGDAPERDETEKILTNFAINNGVPVFGICRGMQFLADYFGAELFPVDNHAGVRHEIHGLINRKSVNSFHTFGLKNLPNEFRILAKTSDDFIEAFEHKNLKIAAVFWHPERERIFDNEDVAMIKNFFK